jgi:AcrR family transcriptional regulator
MATRKPAKRPKVSPEPLPLAVPDERVKRSKELVLTTTWALLVENGLSGVSVDEVARRSGVAKTTIYRHWRTRSDLVFDACSLINPTQEPRDSGSVEGDVTALLLTLSHMLQTAGWPNVMPSIVDAGERDPELAAVFSRQQLMRTAPLLQVIERAKKRGQVSVKADASAMVAQLIGPLFYRRWFSREPLDEKFIKSVVKAVVSKA